MLTAFTRHGFVATAPLIQRCSCGAQKTTSGEECDECKAGKRRMVQRRRESGGRSEPGSSTPGGATADAMALAEHALRSGSEPLPAEKRAMFEARFQHDFRDVRVHTNDAAAQSARALNAAAYTSGPNIVFGRRQFAAGSAHGDRLLAHELTHVVQQRHARPIAGLDAPETPAEREAEHNAARLSTGAALTGTARPHVLSRREADESTTTMTEPAGPGACGIEQHRAIVPAVTLAEQWLTTTIAGLDTYVAAPADPANAHVGEALDRQFDTTDPDIAGRLSERFETLKGDLTEREEFSAECHTDTDTSCTNAGAYIRDNNMLVYCPGFFSASSTEWRAGSLIHEMTHALLGLDIADRAYGSDRLYSRLTTPEAMDNAESHEFLARELGTGERVESTAPDDDIEDCAAEVKPDIDEALARAQRWNRDAESVMNDARPDMVAQNVDALDTHLGASSEATRTAAAAVYSKMYKRLKKPVEVHCDNEAAPQCSDRLAYRGAGKSNVGLGLGIGAAIGGTIGAVAGSISGVALGSVGIGLGIGLGALGLGLLIGLIAGLASSTSEAVHVCAGWSGQDPDDRTESLLAALYETYGGLSALRSKGHASLARALHAEYIGPPPPL